MTPLAQQNGVVAILDALGAATYTDADIQNFLESRKKVIASLQGKLADMSEKMDPNLVLIFTFNDTIIIAFGVHPKLSDFSQISNAFVILRKFLVDSMVQKILFRGAISIGRFYAEDSSNTIMGEAVSDAAAWYDKSDWIGIHATPKASIILDQHLEPRNHKSEHLIVDYDVPLNDGKISRLKSVNWPKAFFVPSVSPCNKKGTEREKLLELLSHHPIPRGTETKYFNTLRFFDHITEVQMSVNAKP